MEFFHFFSRNVRITVHHYIGSDLTTETKRVARTPSSLTTDPAATLTIVGHRVANELCGFAQTVACENSRLFSQANKQLQYNSTRPTSLCKATIRIHKSRVLTNAITRITVLCLNHKNRNNVLKKLFLPTHKFLETAEVGEETGEVKVLLLQNQHNPHVFFPSKNWYWESFIV